MLIQLSEGILEGGDFGVTGAPLVKPAVRAGAAVKLLELCGLNPPARVKLEPPPDGSSDSLAQVAETMTTAELRILVTGFDRAKRGETSPKASELPADPSSSGSFDQETTPNDQNNVES